MIVITKNPSDFIGGYIGHSEMQTKAILDNTVGKVLIIDEVRGIHFLAILTLQLLTL